jgi:hypothetical protein
MGMFDYVRVEGHILPGLDPKPFEERQDENESLVEGPAVFQTKDLENYLGTYLIEDGRFFERIYETEKISGERAEGDEDNPFFFWPVLRRTGCYEDRDLDYHGDVRFYASKKELELAEDWESGWVDFEARFTHGDLEWIKLVE